MQPPPQIQPPNVSGYANTPYSRSSHSASKLNLINFSGNILKNYFKIKTKLKINKKIVNVLLILAPPSLAPGGACPSDPPSYATDRYARGPNKITGKFNPLLLTNSSCVIILRTNSKFQL